MLHATATAAKRRNVPYAGCSLVRGTRGKLNTLFVCLKTNCSVNGAAGRGSSPARWFVLIHQFVADLKTRKSTVP